MLLEQAALKTLLSSLTNYGGFLKISATHLGCLTIQKSTRGSRQTIFGNPDRQMVTETLRSPLMDEALCDNVRFEPEAVIAEATRQWPE